MSDKTKERPILFSGAMVRAILEGRKTQTRRVLKAQFEGSLLEGPKWYEPEVVGKDGESRDGKPIFGAYDPHGEFGIECPFEPNMKLWVRESFKTDIRDPLNCVIYAATPEYGKYRDTGELVRASFPDGSLPTREESERAMLPKFWKGKPSIHMPRWASRITLEITGVRVERLNDISEQDAVAEGIEPLCGFDPEFCAVECFEELWQSINGPDSWAANPWVWVVEFKRVAL